MSTLASNYVLHVLFNNFKACNNVTRTKVVACWKQNKTDVLDHCLLTMNMSQPERTDLLFLNMILLYFSALNAVARVLCCKYSREYDQTR